MMMTEVASVPDSVTESHVTLVLGGSEGETRDGSVT